VDIVQIREPDLSARDILAVSDAVGESAGRENARVLINDRADIAACSGAGVQLTTRSLTVEVVRKSFGRDMLVGVSTHSFEEAKAAEVGGADFIVFGPVFETASKKQYGNPVGLESLRRVAMHLNIPVLALGGIKPSNIRESLEAGAAGVAGISMFTEADDLRELVANIKGHALDVA